ncbi:hypothetical protein QQX98_008427 [Neonectria punicea]|uniref:Uncharacterized protein n=1 Tax=Neonectria punicea TaxID=979145 RepID=A0ABR1GV11_9HYPO
MSSPEPPHLKGPVYNEDQVKQSETDSYHDPVLDGCCPLYPIDRLEDIIRNPEQQPLTRQFSRWEGFRGWQRENRDREAHKTISLPEVQWLKGQLARHASQSEVSKRAAHIGSERSPLSSNREEVCDVFIDYAEAVKRRLTRHNFTQPFKLNRDIKQQDRLATWIEYLKYEYCFLDVFTRSQVNSKLEFDRFRKILLSANVIQPHETYMSVGKSGELDILKARERRARNYTSAAESEVAEAAASVEVQVTKSEAANLKNSTQRDSHQTSQAQTLFVLFKCLFMIRRADCELVAREGQLQGAQSRLERAEADLARARAYVPYVQHWKTLMHLFVETGEKVKAGEEETDHHKILMDWILKQVPLIEAEMLHAEENKAASTSTKRPGHLLGFITHATFAIFAIFAQACSQDQGYH